MFEQSMGQSTSTGGSQMGYASEFKARAVKRHLSNGQQSIAKSALDIGVSKTALRVWLAVYNNPVMMAGMKESNKMRPQDWSSGEKVRACFEYERLSLEEQGEFLRREGLHTETLEEWKRLCLEALSINGNQTASRSELNEATRKIKELEQDLNRKNLALAETSALLILKKKANLLWGFEDNE